MRSSILGFFLFISQLVCAQELDLSTYLDLLKRNNIQIRQSENSIKIAGENRKTARGELLPSLGLDASYKRDFTDTYLYINGGLDGFPDKFKTNYKNNIEANLMAEQVLFSPVLSANYKLTKLAEQEAYLRKEDLSKELIHQGSLLFYQALYTRESIAVLKKNQEIAMSQWKQMNALYKEGFVSEIQEKKSQLYYRKTRPLLLSAQNTYAKLLNDLKQLAGIKQSDRLEITGTCSIHVDLWTEKDSSLLFNSKLTLLNKQIEMAEQKKKIQQAQWYPSIKAGIGYAFSAADDKFTFEENNRLSFGQLKLQIPIISGGKNRAQVKIAQLESSDLQLEREHTLLQLHKELENAHLNIRYALEKMEEEKELIHLSERELAVAKEQIRLGAITPLEFKEVRLELTKARLELLNAKLDYRIAHLQLQKILQN